MIEPGKQYRCPYPFKREDVTLYSASGPYEKMSWVPGVYETGEYGHLIADGTGELILDVVSIHKPGKYPERVFYVRTWKDPDGKVFGKGKLRITTMAAFKRMAKGYRYEWSLAVGS